MQQKLDAINTIKADATKVITLCALEAAAAMKMAAPKGEEYNAV
jgi:hypothetical protein